MVGLNFSSATTPELMLKTFDHYCEYRKTPHGVVLAPVQINKWLVLFCDEINLPDMDKYGTQRVISFLRQMVEHGGFYRTTDQTWVKFERIQFVGACNPPTDPGRKPLSHRYTGVYMYMLQYAIFSSLTGSCYYTADKQTCLVQNDSRKSQQKSDFSAQKHQGKRRGG